eukprot:746051-Prymnesium_polylepis.1
MFEATWDLKLMRGTVRSVSVRGGASRTGAPARSAPRRRRADTRTSVTPQARTGRRTTRTAQGDCLFDLSTTPISCQRHRRAALRSSI